MNIFTKKEKQATEPIGEPSTTEEKEIVEKEPVGNCPSCKGEGLVYEGLLAKRCSQCNGTGKIN